jgi:hypothetical protein
MNHTHASNEASFLSLDMTPAALLRVAAMPAPFLPAPDPMVPQMTQVLARAGIKQMPYSSLSWNTKAQKYFFPKGSGSKHAGKFLKATAVRGAIEADIAKHEQAMLQRLEPLQQLAQQRLDGQISQQEWGRAVMAWRDETAVKVKHLHLNHLAAARGGYHAMTPQSYGRVGAFLKFHYGKLGGFATDLYNDPAIALGQSPGRMPAAQRLQLYAKAALFTFEAERTVAHKEQNYTLKRNVPHSKESCTGCLVETQRQQHPIDEGVPIGKRQPCGPGDLCTYEYFF